MKIKKILLYDNADEQFTNLIEFNKETTKQEVLYAITRCKNELEGEYTNEDVYNYLDKYIGIKSIEFLSYERFDY